MSTTVLNEHDANQGAQSKGEFLGMTGNCGWWLLGSAGASVMIVIVLWGVLGVSLLLCVLLGIVMCVLSVAYVFALKNNQPAHYDTDFFEAVIVEAGVLELAFGPRARRPVNPFAADGAESAAPEVERTPRRERSPSARVRASTIRTISAAPGGRSEPPARETRRARQTSSDEKEATISLGAYEKLQTELSATQEELEEALAERGEE